LITEADKQDAFPSVTAQKTASFSLSFRPQPQTHENIVPANARFRIPDGSLLTIYLSALSGSSTMMARRNKKGIEKWFRLGIALLFGLAACIGTILAIFAWTGTSL
jgi:hypothetical protein